MYRFETPQSAEAAFYQAFGQADIELMKTVWAKEGNMSCIHPIGSCLYDRVHIIKSWEAIFGRGPSLELKLIEVHRIQSADIAVHSLFEHITIIGTNGPPLSIMVTNAYRLIEDSWHMFLHHASSPDQLPKEETEDTPKIILH